MDDVERRELWAAELEALEATYGVVEERGDDDGNCENDDGGGEKTSTSTATSSSILAVLSRDPPALRALLSPRGWASCFVRAELVVECSERYPGEGDESLVSLSLSSPKGLGDEQRQQLLSKINATLREVSALGELCVLGSLIEAALEAITDLNRPEGNCPICLEALLGGGGEEEGEGGDDDDNGGSGNSDNSINRLVKLECFHCLHLRCAVRWWGATKKEEGKEEENEAEQSDESKTREKTRKTLRCPQCREVAEVGAAAAARLDALALSSSLAGLEVGAEAAPAAAAAAPEASAPASSSSASSPSSASIPVSSWGLRPCEVERLREEQALRKEGVARQAARGALVSERWAVSLSELSSSAAAAAASTREEEEKEKEARPAAAASNGRQQKQRGAGRGARGRGGRRGGGGGRSSGGGGGGGEKGRGRGETS